MGNEWEMQDPTPFLKKHAHKNKTKQKHPQTGKVWSATKGRMTLPEALGPDGGAPASQPCPSSLLGLRHCLTPYPIPSSLWALEPFIPTVCYGTAPAQSARRASPEVWEADPRRGDGPRKRHLLTTLPGPLRLPPLGAGTTPSRDGEGGRPGAGGLWLGRSNVGPGEEAVRPGGSAWGRRACWVPLAKSPRSR